MPFPIVPAPSTATVSIESRFTIPPKLRSKDRPLQKAKKGRAKAGRLPTKIARLRRRSLQRRRAFDDFADDFTGLRGVVRQDKKLCASSLLVYPAIDTVLVQRANKELAAVVRMAGPDIFTCVFR